MKNFLIAAFILLSFTLKGHSQERISDYKYIVIPQQYEFVKGKDKYRLNTQTRYLFKQNGYNAVFDEEIPNDAKRCDMLWLDATGSAGIVYTKVRFLLKDCNGFIVFKSSEGKSKEKEYAKSYREAIDMAFLSIEMKSLEEKENYSGPGAMVSTTAAAAAVTGGAVISDANTTEVIETPEKVAKVETTEYTFEDYHLVFTEAEIEVHYEGEKIGKMLPLKGTEGYSVETSQFSGYGYKKDGLVIVERVIEGMSDPVIMRFQKVND